MSIKTGKSSNRRLLAVSVVVVCSVLISTQRDLVAVNGQSANAAATGNSAKPGDNSKRTGTTTANKPKKHSDEDIKNVIDYISKHRPELAKQLSRLKNDGKDETFNRYIERLAPKILSLIRKAKTDPEGVKLLELESKYTSEAFALSRKLKQSKDKSEQDKIRKVLRDSLENSYNMKVKIQEHELSKLDKRIRKLRDEINKQKKAKQKWIEAKLKQAEPQKKKVEKKDNSDATKNTSK